MLMSLPLRRPLLLFHTDTPTSGLTATNVGSGSKLSSGMEFASPAGQLHQCLLILKQQIYLRVFLLTTIMMERPSVDSGHN